MLLSSLAISRRSLLPVYYYCSLLSEPEISVSVPGDERSSSICMARKRSVAWGYFKTVDTETVQCVLCSCQLGRNEHGNTSAMIRHLRKKHPGETGFPKRKSAGPRQEVHCDQQHEMETDGEHFCSVEVALEDDENYNIPAVNDADINSAIDGILEPAHREGDRPEEEMSNCLPAKTIRKTRSLIWTYFERLDVLGPARCRICDIEIQCPDSSTSNLHRHVSKKHPEVSLRLNKASKPPPSANFPPGSNNNSDTATTPAPVGASEQGEFSVEMQAKEGESFTGTTVNETDINSAINGILEAAQGEDDGDEAVSDRLPAKLKRGTRSVIWRHFEHLVGLGAASCRICKKKLRCPDSSTSNLHRHMSKRHPLVSLRMGKLPPLLPASSARGSNVDRDATTMLARDQRDLSVSRSLGGERRVLKRERELIEALRRTQKEEARALEHQRQLLEKLHAVSAREAAAEKEQIDSLRKLQQEEARDLVRQREEVRTEKVELQKKWEEFLSISRDQTLASQTCGTLVVLHEDE